MSGDSGQRRHVLVITRRGASGRGIHAECPIEPAQRPWDCGQGEPCGCDWRAGLTDDEADDTSIWDWIEDHPTCPSGLAHYPDPDGDHLLVQGETCHVVDYVLTYGMDVLDDTGITRVPGRYAVTYRVEDGGEWTSFHVVDRLPGKEG